MEKRCVLVLLLRLGIHILHNIAIYLNRNAVVERLQF